MPADPVIIKYFWGVFPNACKNDLKSIIAVIAQPLCNFHKEREKQRAYMQAAVECAFTQVLH